jgi:lipopolysaccharide export system protein LptA
MKFANKFVVLSVLAGALFLGTGCGGSKTAEGGSTESSATSIEGKWTLTDVSVDIESMPAEMKAKMADPKMKEMMDNGMKQMVQEGMSIELLAGGKAKMVGKGTSEDGTYEYKDKTLTLTDSKKTQIMNVAELTGSTLNLSMDPGGMKMNMKFKK